MENEELKNVNASIQNAKPMNFADRQKLWVKSINNGFLKFLAGLLSYFLVIGYDFGVSIKRNPSKGAGLLIASPGIFIGFFLGVQITASQMLTANNSYGSFALFVLVLLSTINIFNAVTVGGKRNLASVITASLTTLALTVAGCIYLNQFIKQSRTDDSFTFRGDIVTSMICVSVSMLFSIAGCIIGFIFRNKQYVKERF